MEIAMPFLFLAMYSSWWKAVLKPKEPIAIVLLPDDKAPELAVTSSAPAGYQG
jgi:hypothetical protein